MTDTVNTSDSQDPKINYIDGFYQNNYEKVVGYQIKIEDGSIHQQKLMTSELSKSIAQCLQSDPTASDEVLVERLKSDDHLIKFNSNSLAFQTLVEDGGVANVGVHLHDFDEDKLEKVLKAFYKSLQPVEIPSNVPHSKVTKFIGREYELEQLHTQLQQGNLVSISSIEGMAGIGKTELAIHYTQQYASSYEGGICWLFAREFNIGTQIVGFAQSQLNLKIPEGLELVDEVAFCWRNWRTGDVLLVLDDVVNYPRDVEPYLPPAAFTRFRVLMTTRYKFGKPIQSLSLDVLSPEQSLELLTVLIGEIRVSQEIDIAKALCQWTDGLVLALELIGRYLLKRKALPLSTLLFRLQEKAISHAAFKPNEQINTSTAKRGVEAAFDLSWEELDKESQHLGKLLCLFASAPIPWHLVEAIEQQYCKDSESMIEFNPNALKNAKKSLENNHLLQQIDESKQIYKLNNLVREFFRSKLDKEDNRKISTSVISELQENINLKQESFEVLVNKLSSFSENTTQTELNNLALLIPHLESIITSIFQDGLASNNLIRAFGVLGRFYQHQGLYKKAENYYHQSLDIAQKYSGNSHPSIAKIRSSLAYVYWLQGQYSKAKTSYEEVLNLNIKLFGADNPVIANDLNNLADLYEYDGCYPEAESLYVEALQLNRKSQGEANLSTAYSMNRLASLYATQGRYSEAESLYLEVLTLYQQLLGENHPIVASTLNYLANLYHNQGRYQEAEVFFLRSLQIRETQLGVEHLDTATSLNNLAALYKAQCRYEEAECIYLRSLQIRENQLGVEHLDTATSLNNLATLYESIGRYEEAEQLYLKSLQIRETQLGADHPDIATSLNNLAAIYEAQCRYNEAEQLHLQALKIYQQTLGVEHPQVAQSFNNLAGLYKSRGELEKAESLYLQSLEIRERILGFEHPSIANSLNNLAVLYTAQGLSDKAKPLFQRALEISQRSLGNDHPLSKSLEQKLEAVE